MTPALVGGPAAWRGEDIAGDPSWCHRLHDAALGAAVDLARTLAPTVRVERSLASIGRRDVALGPLVALGAAIGDELVRGRGFALLRGLPVDGLDDVERQVLFWAIGVHVGIPLRQNEAGDVLVRVRDEGKDFGRIDVRAYETTADLDYHTDSADVVALSCLRPARTGGTSTIVSSVTVHDEMVRRRPDLAALLYEPWPQLSPVGGAVTYGPICAVNGGGLCSRYGRKYTELAPRSRSDVAPLTPDQVAALDLYDEITRTPGLALDMDFRPGDVQFLNNHRILHARTAYEDWPEPARRRELLRLWLVLRDDAGLDLPEAFREMGFVSRAVAADVA